MIAAALAAASLTFGVHLGGVHVPDYWFYEKAQPGIYARVDQWQVGLLRNSHRRTAVYGGYVQPVGPLDVMVGLTTGYQRKCTTWSHGTASGRSCPGYTRGAIGPALAISYAAPPVRGATPRVWVMPGRATAIHLSLEWTR